jgi:hypothetical protein
VKTLCILLFLVIISCASSPPVTRDIYLPELSAPIDIDKSKTQLFKESMIWLARSFKSEQYVIKYENHEIGLITCHVSDYLSYRASPKDDLKQTRIDFKIVIDMRDRHTEISIIASQTAIPSPYILKGYSDKEWNYIQEDLGQKYRSLGQGLIDSYKSYVYQAK